jgi:type IV secretory pathway VirJ component
VTLAEWPAADRHQVAGLVLIAPSKSASFEIDPLDWVRTPADNPATHTVPAMRQLGLPLLCLAGADETDSPCPTLAGAPGIRISRLPGSHHFKGDYAAVADTVSDFIRSTSADKRP